MAAPNHQRWPEGYLPFLAVAVTAQITLAVPIRTLARPGWGLAGSIAFAVVALASLAMMRVGRPPLMAAIPPYLFIGIVAMWVQADGGSRSAYAVMYGLAVLWFGLHGSTAQVWGAALERQREAAEGLAELDGVRSEMMATISHELRTPLTSIHGYLEMLADGDAGQLTAKQAEMVEVAVRNAGRLSALVDGLLVLTRLDANERPAVVVQLDVARLVDNALHAVRAQVDLREQMVDVQVRPGLPSIAGDAEQLDRVLVNLLSNASKYTAAGGRIDVSVDREGKSVAITVSDSGIGIPEAELPQLFERFFRASSGLAYASGSGLGLAIVKSIVERHGGTITVHSTLGVGSRFTVAFPVTQPAVGSGSRSGAMAKG